MKKINKKLTISTNDKSLFGTVSNVNKLNKLHFQKTKIIETRKSSNLQNEYNKLSSAFKKISPKKKQSKIKQKESEIIKSITVDVEEKSNESNDSPKISISTTMQLTLI